MHDELLHNEQRIFSCKIRHTEIENKQKKITKQTNELQTIKRYKGTNPT